MLEQIFKNIDGVLRKRAGRTTQLDYTEIAQFPTRPAGPVVVPPKQPALL